MKLGLELQIDRGLQTTLKIAELPTNLLGEPDFKRLSTEMRIQGWRVMRVFRGIALVFDKQHDDIIAVEIPLPVTRAGDISIEKAKEYCDEFQWEFIRLAVDGDAKPANLRNRKTGLTFTANIVRNHDEDWHEALDRYILRSGNDPEDLPLLEFIDWWKP